MEGLTADDIHAFHAAVVRSDPATEPGIRDPGAVEFAVAYVNEGHFGQVPETVHEKAAHLMRLIAAFSPVRRRQQADCPRGCGCNVDRHGYELEPDDAVRGYLKGFATDADSVDMNALIAYLEARAVTR